MSEAGPAVALGLDVGTSGIRAALLSGSGALLGLWRRPLPAPIVQGDRIEQDPSIWAGELDALISAIGQEIDLGHLKAIAIDGTSGTLLACDARGQPLGPALMYHDRRASAQAARLQAVAPAESGAHGASSSLSKWLWLSDQGLLTEPAYPCHQADWLLNRWLGFACEPLISDENNALKLGYDPVLRRWPDWLDDLIPTSRRPSVLPPGTVVGPIYPQVARQLGLPETVMLVTGTTDSIAAVYATGAHKPGDAITSLGSTLALKLVSPLAVFDPASGVYSHRFGDHFLVGGASNTGGAVLAALFPGKDLAELSARIDPRRRSCLEYYPLLQPGERFPINDPNLPPKLTPRPKDASRYLHGMLEAMARIEKRGYQRLSALGAPTPQRILTSGGGAANPQWTAIRSRVLGIRVQACSDSHCEAAVGTAKLALKAIS